jgi:transketolase
MSTGNNVDQLPIATIRTLAMDAIEQAESGHPGTPMGMALAVSAYEQLTAEGIKVRVASVPSWTPFEQQGQAYHDAVLPPQVTARGAIEQASCFGWAQCVGLSGAVVGMKTFGASAPLKELLRKPGFTVDAVVAAANDQLAKAR